MTAINREAEEALSYNTLTTQLSYNPISGLFYWKVRASTRMKPGLKAGTVKGIYIRIRINGKDFYAHRLAWFYVYKKWPKGIVDHIDRNSMNNSIDNLRDTNYSVNNRNKDVQKRNLSGHAGITFVESSYRWRVQIRVNKKLIHVGCFLSKEAAIKAKEAALLAHNLTI